MRFLLWLLRLESVSVTATWFFQPELFNFCRVISILTRVTALEWFWNI